MGSIEEKASKLVTKFKLKGVELNTLLKVAIKEASIIVENDAVLTHPWKNQTGLLEKSITHRIIERKGYPVGQVGTSVEYAEHLEFGSSRNKPYPFLRPSLNRNRAKIKRIIEARLKQAL